MSERSVQLHLRTPTERQDFGLGAGSSQGMPDQPGEGSADRFKQALAKAADLAPPVPGPAEQPLSHPMGLFGAAPATLVAPAVDNGLLGLLKDSLKGLQVGQEQRGVRMELDEALYPGVAVSVFEDAGAWVAQFRCREIESYRALAEPAQDMARRLAAELRRDALWRVIDESAGPVAEGDSDHTLEAFASAPPG